jgi:hypothetical protein
MEIESIYWARQRENNALLREALALLRRIADRLDTGAPPIPTSPPSSPSPTAMPSTTPASLLKRLGGKLLERLGREAMGWLLKRILVWSSAYILPTLLGWMMLGRPALRWIEAWLRWLAG